MLYIIYFHCICTFLDISIYIVNHIICDYKLIIFFKIVTINFKKKFKKINSIRKWLC